MKSQTILKSLARNVTAYRNQQGLSVRGLELETKVAADSISAMESGGERSVLLVTLLAFSEAIGVSVKDLLGL